MVSKEFENLRALTAWDDGEDIKLVCKLQNPEGKWLRGVKTITGFEWYFAISRKDFDRGDVERLVEMYHDKGVVTRLEMFNEDWVKIYARKGAKFEGRYTLKAMLEEFRREGITLYESDLSLWKRFMTDNQIEIAGELDILYFDIETDDTQGGIEIGRDAILSWAGVNKGGETFYFVNDGTPDGEEKLLKSFLTVAAKHDLLCGWNSGGFDLPYIQGRMAVYGMDPEQFFKKKLHIDMMQRCARVYSYDMFNIGLKGFSLNEVVRVFLNESKVEHKEGIKEMWEKNPTLLKEYNIKDAELLYRLDKKLLITDLMIKECQWTGAFLDRFYIGELLDNYILRRTHELGSFQFARPEWQEKSTNDEINIRGGFVMEPLPGVYDNVRVCDFKSLYPSIIVGFNIGRDSLNKEMSDDGFIALDEFLTTDKARRIKTKIEDVPFEEWKAFLESEKKRLDPDNTHIQAANNTYYRRDKISFVGGLVKHLLDLRAQWKAQAKHMDKESSEYVNIQQSQGIVKEMANSMYGITGDKSSRYFDQHVAEAITLTGQYMNRLSAFFSKKHGYTTIYGDTDSIFIPVLEDADMNQLIIDINKDLADWLDNDIGAIDNIVQLQYEKKFSKLILQDKKRYTGRMVLYDGTPVNKIFSRGTENIKKSTIRVAREALIELINLLVDSKLDLAQAQDWVHTLKAKIFFSKIKPEDLTMTIKVSKSTEKYVSKPLHVRLAERLISEGKLLPIMEGKRTWGTRLDYIVVKDETTGELEGRTLEEFKGIWDKTYYWDVQIYAPVRRMMETAWPEHDWTQYEVALAEKHFNDKVKKETKIFKIIESEKDRAGKLVLKVMKKEEKAKVETDKVEKRREKLRTKLKKSNPEQAQLAI